MNGVNKLNMTIRITFISDTHTKHREIEKDLPGGDIIIHSGDFMNTGYYWDEASDFLQWYDNLFLYDHKVLIAGNHDRLFESNIKEIPQLISMYPNIKYLLDSQTEIYGLKIWGSPWQPEFFNWAFNLPRGGEDLREKWFWIPDNTDILVTHGPPQGILDVSGEPWNTPDLGCELLRERVDVVKPLVHSFGHIHGGGGQIVKVGDTQFINASVLSERYTYAHKPITIDLDLETKEITII